MNNKCPDCKTSTVVAVGSTLGPYSHRCTTCALCFSPERHAAAEKARNAAINQDIHALRLALAEVSHVLNAYVAEFTPAGTLLGSSARQLRSVAVGVLVKHGTLE